MRCELQMVIPLLHMLYNVGAFFENRARSSALACKALACPEGIESYLNYLFFWDSRGSREGHLHSAISILPVEGCLRRWRVGLNSELGLKIIRLYKRILLDWSGVESESSEGISSVHTVSMGTTSESIILLAILTPTNLLTNPTESASISFSSSIAILAASVWPGT